MPEITAVGNILQFFPILAPYITVAFGPIQVPSPISTFLSINAKGSTVTLLPSFASGCTKARFEIIVLNFILNNLCCKFSFKDKLISDKCLSEHCNDTSPDKIGKFHFQYNGIAGNDFILELNFINFKKICGILFRFINSAQNEQTTSLGEGFNKKHTRAIGSSQRILVVGNNPAYVTGNRYGLPMSVPLDWNEFVSAVMHATGSTPAPAQAA